MNRDKLHDAIGELSETLTSPVGELREGAKKKRKRKALFAAWASAACLCIILIAAIIVYGVARGNVDDSADNGGPTKGEAVLEAEDASSKTDTSCSDAVMEEVVQSTDETVPIGDENSEDDAFSEEGDEEGDTIPEVPSVTVKVLSVSDTCFTAKVEGIVDTEVFELGTVLTVDYDKGTYMFTNPPEDESSFPFSEGSVVTIMFIPTETEDRVYAEMIASPEHYE